MSNRTNGIQSVALSFEIIEKIVEMESVGVTELARELELKKSTAHAHMNTLLEMGYLRKVDGQYFPSLKFLGPAGKSRQRLSLFRVGKGHVDQLAQETGLHSGLGVNQGGMRMMIYTSEGSESISNIYSEIATIGVSVPMNCTAVGKAILSKMDHARVQAILGDHGLNRSTEKSITDRDMLFEELEQISEQGYSVEDEEYQIGSRAMAAPVQANDHGPNGAISLAGPKNQMTMDRIHDELSDVLIDRANIINLRLGTRPGAD